MFLAALRSVEWDHSADRVAPKTAFRAACRPTSSREATREVAEMVSQCESDDSAFGDRTVGQLKSELQRLRKQASDLLEMFPEFDEYRSQEPASLEEEELARLEDRINAIKLELVKRGEVPARSREAPGCHCPESPAVSARSVQEV